MSKNIKDSLHELIMHMSKSEKRYFKVVSSRHTIGEENNYILLFDLIEKMEIYHEETIFLHFKGEAFLNKLSITKKRLYDHIIAALDSFHSANSIDSQIYKLLNSARILSDKSLYKHAIKQLKTAEKIAEKHSKFNLLNEINFQVKKIHESQHILNENELSKMLQNDILFHEKSLSYSKIWNLKTKLFALLASKGVSRSDKDVIQFKSIIDELMESVEEKYLYFETNYLINHIYSAYYFAINSFNACFKYLNQNISLIESSPTEKENYISNYISVITNTIYVGFRLNKTGEIKLLREKLKSFTKDENVIRNEDLNLKLFTSFYSIELTILTIEGNNSEAEKLIPLIQNGLRIYDEKLTENRKTFFHFKIACVYFAQKEFHLALKSINTILNEGKIDHQEDIVSFSHLLSLLIHIEMKNLDFIPYVVRSTMRYLKSKNRMYPYEVQILKFITKLSKNKNDFDQEEIALDFYNSLSKIEDSNMEKIAYDYFDFITWAQAKSQRKPFEKLLIEKKTLH